MPSVPALDPYAVLGINRDAAPEEIKAAYRRRSKDTHPDTGGSQADFARVQAAYELLRDPTRRERFDKTGDASETKPDNTDQMAFAVIDGMIVETLQQDGDPFTCDLTQVLISRAERRIQLLAAETDRLRRVHKRAVRLLGRFSRKALATGEPPGDNVLNGMVKWHVEGLEQAQAKTAEDIRHIRRAIELLRDYDFRRDPPQSYTFIQPVNSANGGFFGGINGLV